MVKPTELHIGPAHIYPIIFKNMNPNEEDKEDETTQGQCLEDKFIEIETRWPEAIQKSTLLHEIIHAIGYYLADSDFSEDDIKVTRFANVLYDVMVTNPEVAKYLFT
jgi:hypothetical protein